MKLEGCCANHESCYPDSQDLWACGKCGKAFCGLQFGGAYDGYDDYCDDCWYEATNGGETTSEE